MLGDDPLPPLRNLTDGVIPGDTGPLAAPLGADPAEWVLQPLRRVDTVQIRTHLGAEPAPREGMIGIAVKAHRTAITYLDQRGAGIRAVVWAGATDEGSVG